MNLDLERIGAWLADGGWMILAIGFVACSLAFYFGRRWITTPAPLFDENDPVAAFEATFLSGVSKDRRSAPRRRGNTVEVQLSSGVSEEMIRGWVLDRSIGGLGILVDHPVPLGTALKVRPRNTSESIPWTDVTVRFCHKDGGQFELGCQFHRTPNWGLLLQFG